MARAQLVCKSCEEGVAEACARQAKGRRGAANGFAALQDLDDGQEEAACDSGDKVSPAAAECDGKK
jgi:hypothetical protein